MKDLIDRLRSEAQVVPVPLELPDEDLLVEIEEQILIPLPKDFKAFLLTVSDLVIGSLEPVTVTDPASHTYLPEVAAQAWADGLPRELIPVCYNYQGYFVMNQTGEVAYWQTGTSFDEDSASEDTWDSIWHWAEQVWLQS